MKGIILAAGRGSRLMPLTANLPKCLVSYRGKPLLDYTLSNFNALGVDSVTIVCGYQADTIARPNLIKLVNPEFDSTNMVYSLFLAEHEFTDDLIISYGDIIYNINVLRALLKSRAHFAIAVDKSWRKLWSRRMEDPLADAETLRVSSEGKVVELGKRPKTLEEIEGQYIGLILIRKPVIRQIVDFYHSLDREALYDGRPFNQMFMTTFIQLVIDSVMPVEAAFFDGGWLEVDAPSDLKIDVDGL